MSILRSRSVLPLWRYWIIDLGCCMHVLWAGLLIAHGEVLRTASLGPLYEAFGSSYVALVVALLMSATLALIQLLTQVGGSWGRLWCLLPQQYLLTVSALGSLTHVLSGAYADGVQRPMAFIGADQAPMILLAVVHFCAVYHAVVGEYQWPNWGRLFGRRT